jgi:hypothetical protein
MSAPLLWTPQILSAFRRRQLLIWINHQARLTIAGYVALQTGRGGERKEANPTSNLGIGSKS